MTDSEYIGALWRRAIESLNGAEALVPIDSNAAASRAYYAAFHAVSALFGLEGRTFKKHTDVAASVPRDLGAAFSQLSSQRRIGDYGAVGRVSGEEAAICVDLARSILDAVSHEHPKTFPSSMQD